MSERVYRSQFSRLEIVFGCGSLAGEGMESQCGGGGKKKKREKGIRGTFAGPSVGSAVCLSAGHLVVRQNEKEKGMRKTKRREGGRDDLALCRVSNPSFFQTYGM